MQLKTEIWKLHFETDKPFNISKIGFSVQGGAVVFVGIFCQPLPLRNFCYQKLLKGNLFKIFLQKVARENAVQIISIFPPKVLVFGRKMFLNTF